VPAANSLCGLGQSLYRLPDGIGISLIARSAHCVGGFRERLKAQGVATTRQGEGELNQCRPSSGRLRVLEAVHELAELEHEPVDLGLEVGLVVTR
jgi:hypothetical protein